MALLKAVEVEYVPLPETTEDTLSEEEREEREDEGFIIGEPIIIGGELAEVLLTAAEEMAIGRGAEVIVGEPIIIGGVRREVIEEEYQPPEIIEQEIIEEHIGLPEEETSKEALSIHQDLISQFSQGLQAKEIDANAPEWMQTKQTLVGTIDNKIKNLIREYRDNIISSTSERASLLAETERERILSEAVKEVAESKDVDTYQRVIANIDSKIFDISQQYQQETFMAIESQRDQMIKDMEMYVETSIESQRELIMQEANEFIEKMMNEYKERLESDNTLISTANNIIARREEILDEAYNKSLQMIQEAQSEVDRIKEEEMQIQDRINELLTEAETKAEIMKSEAQEEAERIISEANMESARIIEEAEKSHQEIVEAATHDGFNVGYQEGREEAIKENAQLLMETTNALNRLHAAFPIAVKQNEDKLIKLALEISGAVIQEELATKPEICMRTVESAVKRVSDLERVIIKVNPLDLDLVLPKQEYFRALLPDVQEFVITGHYSIARGGCLIETNSGTIDAQITTQLAVVDEVFQKIRSEYDYEEGGEELANE